MARILMAALCVAAALIPAARSATPLEYGMEMSSRAYDAVCWYENLKIFPNTNVDGFLACQGQVAFQKTQILTSNKEFFAAYPDQQVTTFGQWVSGNDMQVIPAQYNNNCGQLLTTPTAAATSDESDALNDRGYDYPYKAFAYCLMNTLRQTHGDKAITAVKKEITHTRKNWKKTLLDRDNEFRARHGVQKVELMHELDREAQEWAEENARSCNMHHSDNGIPGRQFMNFTTGESLSGGYEKDKSIAAYEASNGWYEEIKNYPYPQGFDGQDDQLFKKIGHFTQSVWKNTKYVGYGYAFNPNCAKRGQPTSYITGRYSPPGNFNNEYPTNVLPPQN